MPQSSQVLAAKAVGARRCSLNVPFPARKKPAREKIPFPGKCSLYLVKVNKSPH